MIIKTTIGPIELSFNDKAITGIKLLEPDVKPRKDRHAPPFVHDAARAIAEHLLGNLQDFTRVPLDYSDLPAFHAKVYEASRRIGSGKIMGYGELAAKVGSHGASRAVGQAMARNPFFVVVPCHRIASSKDNLGGFSAPGGAITKRRMLEIEGAFLEPPPYDVERAVRELKKADPKLAKVITRAGDKRPSVQPLHSVFEALGRSIVYQQLSGRAAGAIHRKYAALFPDHRPTPELLVKMPDDKIRGAGLSANKLLALRDLAAKSISGEVPSIKKLQKMNDDDIIEALTSVRGIGPWTVHMMLIFRLGRADVLPTADYGVRKGFAKTYGKRELPDAKSLTKHAERWRPWRSVASWYMWRATEQE